MEMTATEFKAKCLEVLDQVAATGQPVRITKRGKVVAELVSPVVGAEPGFAQGLITLVGDVVSPTDEPWEVVAVPFEQSLKVAERREPYGD